MVLSFVATLLALLWLVHRATHLFRIPLSFLVQSLGIDIPNIPSITLDAVTSNSVLFHWSSSEKNVVKLMFFLDGTKIGEADRLNSAIILKGLKSNMSYILSAVAVSPNNFQSHASVTRFHTQHPLNEYNETNQNPLKSLMVGDNTAASLLSLDSSISTPFRQNNKSRKRVLSTSTPAKSRNPGQKNQSSGKSKSDVKLKDVNELEEPYTVESLTAEIESMQLDLQEAIANKSEQEREFVNEEKSLIELLETSQAQRKSEENARSQLRTENKALEDVRHGFESEKSKVERLYKKLRDTISRRYQQMEKWQAEMDEASKNLMRSDKVISDMGKKYEDDASNLKREMVDIRKGIISTEKEVKNLNLEMKKLQSIRTTTFESIDEIKKKSDPNSGVVAEETLYKVISQPSIHEILKKELEREVQIETEIETKWIYDQKELEKRYLVAHKQFQEANMAYQRAKEAYDEYVTNISVSEPLAPTSSSVSTNTGHSIYPSTSKPTTGKKRKTRSRRNTKSDGNSSNKSAPDTNLNLANNNFLSVPPNQNDIFNSPSPPFQSLSHHSSFPSLSQSNSPVSGFPVGNSTLFPTHSANSFLPEIQKVVTPSDDSAQNSARQNTLYSSSLPGGSFLTSPENKIGSSSQFSPMSDVGDFQSPSIFVPSYIIKDDTAKDDNTTASNPSSPNYIFPIDRSHSAMSLAAQSLTSQVSAVTRPSAGYLARALRHQSGGSDHSGSAQSSGFYEFDMFSNYIDPHHNTINQHSLSNAASFSSLNDSLTNSNGIAASLGKDEIKPAKGTSMFSSLFGSLKSKPSKKGTQSEQSEQSASQDLDVGIIGDSLQSKNSFRELHKEGSVRSLEESFEPAPSTVSWTPVNADTFNSNSDEKSSSLSKDGWDRLREYDPLDSKAFGPKGETNDPLLSPNSIVNHKSGLLQKGIRTLSLQRKAISSTGTNFSFEKPADPEPENKLAKRLSIFGNKESTINYEGDSNEEKKGYQELLDRIRK